MDYNIYSLNRDNYGYEALASDPDRDKEIGKMKCDTCGKKVTQSQLDHAEAIRTAAGYTHTDCIDDLSRPESDAYHRDAQAARVRDELGREGEILEKLDSSPTLQKKAHWSPVTSFSTRTLQQQLEDQHKLIPQAEQAYRVAFGSSTEVKLESELEFL